MTAANHGPDFLCVGLPKAGTAWLYDQLEFHPQFWMPPVKEFHYFDNALQYNVFEKLHRLLVERPGGLAAANANRKERHLRQYDERDVEFLRKAIALRGRFDDLDGYAALFTPKGDKLSGDITPGYATLPDELVRRICARFPTTKVILMVRDPIERAWSQVNMWMRRFKEGGVVADWDAISERMSQRGFASRSYPTEVWRRWSKHVPPELFQLVFLDDVSEHPAAARENILRFLGADPEGAAEGPQPNYNRKSGKPKAPMSDDIRAGMVERFGEEVLACAEILGGPAKAWPGRYGL